MPEPVFKAMKKESLIARIFEDKANSKFIVLRNEGVYIEIRFTYESDEIIIYRIGKDFYLKYLKPFFEDKKAKNNLFGFKGQELSIKISNA